MCTSVPVRNETTILTSGEVDVRGVGLPKADVAGLLVARDQVDRVDGAVTSCVHRQNVGT